MGYGGSPGDQRLVKPVECVAQRDIDSHAGDGDALSRQNTRQDAAMNSAKPREAGIGRHKGATLREHRDITQNFLNVIDPTFFGTLAGQEARTDEKKKELGEWAAQYLSAKYPSLTASLEGIDAIDQIYDRLDEILAAMLDQMSDAEFRQMLFQIAPVD